MMEEEFTIQRPVGPVSANRDGHDDDPSLSITSELSARKRLDAAEHPHA
jgi:hypothetical protein